LIKGIELGETLDLTQPHTRHFLAKLYANLATSFCDQDTSLQKALKAAMRSIELRADLDMTVVEFRNDLAGSHVVAGDVLSCLGAARWNEALAEYNEALRLCPDGDEALDQRWASTIARATSNRSNTLIDLGQYQQACEELMDSLALLARLEALGVFNLRSVREAQFALCLRCTLSGEQYQLIPEIVLNALDMERPGAAPASFDMHDQAVNALASGSVALAKAGGSSRLPDYGQALACVGRARQMWLAGTAEATRLRSQELERRGDSIAARSEIECYIEHRPGDPQGWSLLAETLVRQQDTKAATAALINLARTLFADADDHATLAEQIAEIGARVLDLRLVSDGWSPTEETVLLERMREVELLSSEWQSFLIRDFRDSVLASDGPPNRVIDQFRNDAKWRALLDRSLDSHWGYFLERRSEWHQQILQRRDSKIYEELSRSAMQFALNSVHTIAESIPVSWSDFTDTLALLWSEHCQSMSELSVVDKQGSGLDERTLTLAVERFTNDLAPRVLSVQSDQLRRQLGSGWDQVLTHPERRMLAAAFRLMLQRDCERYAGLEIALAVEYAIRTRFLNAAKQIIKSGTFDISAAETAVDSLVLATVDGKRKISLGQIVSFYRALLLASGGTTTGTISTSVVRLTEQDYDFEELVGSVRQYKRRMQNLDELVQGRNQCAHHEQMPDRKVIENIWKKIVLDDDDGFFPRLIAASNSGTYDGASA